MPEMQFHEDKLVLQRNKKFEGGGFGGMNLSFLVVLYIIFIWTIIFHLKLAVVKVFRIFSV